MTAAGSIQDLTRAAEGGEVPSVCVLVGTERFLSERALTALRRSVLGDGPPGFNDDVFAGQGLAAHKVLAAARTLPMMAARRIVVVRRVDQMASDDLDGLIDYLQDPAPETCLVLTADKLDARGRFAKVVKQAGAWFDASAPKQHSMRALAEDEARARGHALRPDAALALADAVGTDLAALDDALERLSLYVGGREAIAADDVATCVAHVRAESVWALVDSISARDSSAALGSVGALLADREPPLKILALVARQLRTVARMREALAAGLQPQEAAQRAGAPPFKARDLASSARRFNASALTSCFLILDRTDRDLKGSRVPGPRVLERAVLDLCSAH